MRSNAVAAAALLSLLTWAPRAGARGERRVSLEQALRASRLAAPTLLVARAQESVARAEVGVAGQYPNPNVSAASSTQTAKISGTVSIPLVVLGQRGAAIDAARADQATGLLDTEVTWNDVRQATKHAYVALWLAERNAEARGESAAIEAALEETTVQRVEVGSAPQIDLLRVRAERLRADADVLEASAQVAADASELGLWMGVVDGGALRTTEESAVPESTPALADLLARLDTSAPLRREQADVRAAEARAAREGALARPAMTLDLGVDALDPTLVPPNTTNYRAQLTVELPIFNQRGPQIERERALGEVARARVRATRAQQTAELAAAYRTFEAATARQHVLVDAVVPAARAAAKATEEAYTLGRAPLIAVLDAERALVDARVSTFASQAARGVAWADVEHAVGAP